MPTFTAAEAKALLNLTFGPDFVTGSAKLPDLLTNLIWYENCECLSGAAAALTPPAQPTGVATYIPPQTVNATPCYSYGPYNDYHTAGDVVSGYWASSPNAGVTAITISDTPAVVTAPAAPSTTPSMKKIRHTRTWW